jgi:hypothetical protein
MEPTSSTQCLLGTSFHDMEKLRHTLRVSNVLSRYSMNFSNVMHLETDLRDNTNYFGHDVPFHRLEEILSASTDSRSVVLITDKMFQFDFLKLDEFLMRRYPKSSFFLRNCLCDHIGSQWLLKNDDLTLLIVSLYKGNENDVIINI